MGKIEKEILEEIHKMIREAEKEREVWARKLEEKHGESWQWFYSMCYYAAIGELGALYRVESLIRKKLNIKC